MTELRPISITADAAVFMYRSIRLSFTVNDTSRSLTAMFNNDSARVHTAADWLHAGEIRELLMYFGFNTTEKVEIKRSGGKLTFRQELIVVGL